MNPRSLPGWQSEENEVVKDNGGSAFPIPNLEHDSTFNGMSLRDYFAGLALQGMWACPNPKSIVTDDNKVATDKDLARLAYEQADAMIEARKS